MASSVSASWLNGFDPSNAASIATSLKSLLPAATLPAHYTGPIGFNILKPAPAKAPAGPSQFQKALDAFTVAGNTFLIQSAINGYQPLAQPAAFGSVGSYYQGLGTTASTILAAAKSGHYGNVNALA